MVPAAGVLPWALLLSLGPWAAGAEGPTPTGMQRTSLRLGAPARSRSTDGPSRTSRPRKSKVTLEDENDALATADRLAGPAAAELLATVTGISRSSLASYSDDNDEDGSLEEGVVIDARKNTSPGTPSTIGVSSTGRVIANKQEPEIRLTTSLPSPLPKSTRDLLSSETTLTSWSWPSAGSTPSSGWPSPSPKAMPPPEDLRVVLLPWGPWHCHCKSGTMSRSRAGKLQGLSGRLRVGALNQLRTEHRPCTYRQCPCNRHREECPLDSSLCSETSCSSRTTTWTTTTPHMPPIHLRRRPSLPPPSPSPALAFWKRVRIGLEDIWNSLSSVFTEMQPTDRTRR
uniref:Protein MENT n=1 Tax=Castor canadensis TaxID=51338 RepID=A0A8C0WJ17_CASCN